MYLQNVDKETFVIMMDTLEDLQSNPHFATQDREQLIKNSAFRVNAI